MPAATKDAVIACACHHGLDPGRSGDQVRARSRDQKLDARKADLSGPCGHRPRTFGRKCDLHPRRRGTGIQQVGLTLAIGQPHGPETVGDDVALAARAAVDHIVAAAECQRVVAGTAVKRIVPVPAPEAVIAIAARQFVGSGTAVQRIVAGPARQQVGPVATRQHVGHGTADQGVVERRPRDILETADDIALRKSARSLGQRQIDPHPRLAAKVIDRVDAVAAVQPILLRATRQHIVTRIAVKPVRAHAAKDRVIAASAPDRVGPAAFRIDPKRQGIVALAAKDTPVRSTRNQQHIVACAAKDRIARIAREDGDRVIPVARVDVIAFATPIDDHIVAASRIDRVGPCAAVDAVVTVFARQKVVLGPAP